MKRRLFQETVGRYGFKREFAAATVDTMRDVLAALTKRYCTTEKYLILQGNLCKIIGHQTCSGVAGFPD